MLDTVPQGDGLVDLVRRLRRGGAIGLLTPQLAGLDGFLAKRIVGGSAVDLPVVAVRPDVLASLDGATVRALVPLRRIETAGANVVGQLAGLETSMHSQPLVLTAHYDGVGDDPAHRLPSAADNASGVAVVLEVARVLASLPYRPRRTIMFVALDGEEIGAVGSRLHARTLREAGIRPVVLNLDMVGRFNGAVAVELGPGTEQIVEALDQAGQLLEIPLSVSPVASDNRSYAGAGFPAVGLGLGGASYHSPSDTSDRVEQEALVLAGHLLLGVMWQLAFS
jgi:Zn-dependent M28 family amino/carboxypeptidase